MTLIQKVSFDGVENMDLFSMLTDERNTDIPPYKVLGKKVCEDCAVSDIISIVSSFHTFFIQ